MASQEPIWSSDEEEVQPKCSRPKAAQTSSTAVQCSQIAGPSPQRLDIHMPSSGVAVPTLQALCLGMLGDYLSEYLEYAAELLPLLPSHYKNCLMAIARRQGILTDKVLAVLADGGQGCLDCHGCAGVTEAGIRAALCAMPQLRFVDLSGCPVGPATLRLLGESCPLVEVLRIGRHALTDDDPCARAVRRLLPRLEKEQHADVDSWEALGADADASIAAPSGVLMSLRCLTWPSMPYDVRQYCRTHCSLLCVNPSAEEVAQRGLPPECNPTVPLDAALFTGLVDASRWEQKESSAGLPELHIAEKFRLAYLEQAVRMRERAERAERKQRQRQRAEIRRSPAEMAIRQWLSEM